MTELIWEGKYNNGKKITPIRIALPFQTIETINESAQQRQKTLDFFASEPAAQYSKEWRNRLIWGDKKYVLPSLLPEFAGKVNLIYIDPPFFTGTDQKISLGVPDSEELIIKEPSIIEEAAYRNVWRDGIDSFCKWIHETLIDLRDLLAETGIIFIRYDQYWSHYVKIIADEVFGKNNFQNEITVKRIHKNVTQQGRISIPLATDSLFVYFKTDKAQFNDIHKQLDVPRESYWRAMDSAGIRPNPTRTVEGKVFSPPKGRHFTYIQERVNEMYEHGRVRINKKGDRLEYLVNESETMVLNSNWTDISGYSFTTGYPTENSESLLERVIKAGSSENDLVLDCFCGSGTTAAVSEKLNRRWITCDIGRFAIHTARKRLLSIKDVKPFIVQNLGKYERQQWMESEFANPNNRLSLEKSYKHFIMDLYHAKPLNGYIWLHGSKAGRMVHIGSVDTPVTVEDIKSAIIEFWKLIGKEKSVQTNGIDFLGWDFAFDVNETAKQFAAENKVNVSFKKIPREVLEKKAVEQGDIKFYELASLTLETQSDVKKLTVNLDNFIVPPDDIPQEIQGKITHWSQWIDYWAVDWNYRDDTFHNEWQSYRTKQNSKLDQSVTHVYETSGNYTVLVKVIDILGNDTTKSIHIEA
jgi:adenine-specific DNA-methyltransferase